MLDSHTCPYGLISSQAPFHHTARLLLRHLSASDAGALWEAFQSVEFNKHVLWRTPTARAEVERHVEALLARCERRELAAVSAFCRFTGRWVGLARVFPLTGISLAPGAGQAAEMRLWVHPCSWNDGFGRELTRLVSSVAFQETRLDALYARASTDNPAAQQVLVNAGFKALTPIAIEREDGSRMPGQLYELSRSCWTPAF